MKRKRENRWGGDRWDSRDSWDRDGGGVFSFPIGFSL